MTTEPRALGPVSLVFTPEMQQQLARGNAMLEFAREAFPVLGSAEEANECSKHLRELSSTLGRFKELKDGFVAPAKQIIKNAEALFDPGIIAVEQAIEHDRKVLTDWDAAERARVEREEQERRAEDRRRREAAEKEAAAARARAAEESRQKEEAAQRAREAEEVARREAEESRRRAAEEQNAEERKRLEKEARERDAEARRRAEDAAKREEEARQAEARGEERAASALAEADAASASGGPAPERQKVQGFTTRKNWKAELDVASNDEGAAVLKIASAIVAGRTDLASVLSINWSKAHAWAKAQESQFNVPGLRARDVRTGASAGKIKE